MNLNSKIIFAFIAAYTIISAGYLFSEESVTVSKGALAGTLSKNGKELIVNYADNMSSRIMMGSKLYVIAENEGEPVVIELEVTFPMMTLAKVRVVKSGMKYAALLADKTAVYTSAEIIKEAKVVPLPPDDEKSLKIRQYVSEALVRGSTYKSYEEEKCTEFPGPGKTFLKPDFSQIWKKFSCRFVNAADRNNNIVSLNMREGQLNYVFGEKDYFYKAAEKYTKEQVTDPAEAKKYIPDSEYETKLLGSPLIKTYSAYDDNGNGNKIVPFNYYDPEKLDALGMMLYPRDKWFGSIAAEKIYQTHSLYLRYFARLAVRLDKDKNLHKKLMDIQQQCIKKVFYIGDKIGPVLKNAGIPDFYSSHYGEIKYQFAAFYLRRELDGTLKVILKYMWMAFRDFDPEFYNQPDIKAFGNKIYSM